MLAANHGYIQEEVKRVEKWGVDALHLDIMELGAVSDIGFSPRMIEAIRSYTRLPLDCHMMLCNYEKGISCFSKCGMDRLVMQYETAENIKSLIEQARYYVKKVGVAIGPNTPVEGKESLFQMCDIVTFMSVEPGQAGSVFCENVLEKIMRFRQITYSWEKKPEICVDGGINLKNAIRCREMEDKK